MLTGKLLSLHVKCYTNIELHYLFRYLEELIHITYIIGGWGRGGCNFAKLSLTINFELNIT